MKKILLVEDTLHLANEIGDILRLEGFEISYATGAIQGLEFLPTLIPNLIITDLLMPVMDGFEFIMRVRELEQFKLIPIIILSARTTQADRNRGTEVGANAFLSKPCEVEELVASVNFFLA